MLLDSKLDIIFMIKTSILIGFFLFISVIYRNEPIHRIKNWLL